MDRSAGPKNLSLLAPDLVGGSRHAAELYSLSFVIFFAFCQLCEVMALEQGGAMTLAHAHPEAKRIFDTTGAIGGMSGGQGITRELSLGELVTKTFELYRRDFSKYLILFVVVEAVIGVLTTLVRRAIVLPAAPPAGATAQQVLNWLPGFFGAVVALIALGLIVSWVFYPISIGGAVKMASDEITTGKADLAASVRFVASRIVWLWAVILVVGIIVVLGLIALLVPGIILSIMFSLAVPVIMIEGTGFESMGRSRKLVSQRWLKTLGLVILVGIVVGIASAVVSAVTGPLGVASTIVSSIVSALYIPLPPIALTVYYYSNAARIAPPQTGRAQASPTVEARVGMKFCSSCGTEIGYAATFCPACGAKQRA